MRPERQHDETSDILISEHPCLKSQKNIRAGKKPEHSLRAQGGLGLWYFGDAVRLWFSVERPRMGKPNNALGVYMNRQDRIRSVLEYYLGEKLPEDFSCEEIRGQYSVWESGSLKKNSEEKHKGGVPARNAGGRLSFRQRDYLGRAHAWGTDFLLGVENQQRENLILPWRLMELDYLTYGEKIEANREENNRREVSYGKGDDFLYRYRREDRVELVLNLVLYWGKEEWETPLSLREMAGDVSRLPEKLLALAGDYRVCVIHMRGIPEEAVRKMDSDLRYVLGLMRCADSPEAYGRYLQENREFFSRIPRSAFDVIDCCVNIRGMVKELNFMINQETGEEEADMCKALAGIERNAERRGKEEGMREGKEEGMREGKKEGIKEGMKEGIQQVGALMRRLLAEGKQEEVLKAAKDGAYLQRLLLEYDITP